MRSRIPILLAIFLTGFASAREPELWLVASPADLQAVASAIAHGDKSVTYAYEDLKRDARKALDQARFSVTDKETSGESGDKHDYFSLESSWWPDPAKPDGIPYVRRQGESNPASKDLRYSDSERLRFFTETVETLGLAWQFLHEDAYAEKAAELFRAWFLDDSTRMNPHLNYARAAPGAFSGQEEGILEGRHFIRVMQASLWLRGSTYWTEPDQAALRKWFRDYLSWLETSAAGRDERNSGSNHGSWYDTQVAAVALFVGESEKARDTLNHLRTRWKKQFLPNGAQPLESERSSSLHYSIFNLIAHLNGAQLGKHAGLDLWGDPASPLETAADNLIPYLTGREKWPHSQSEALDPDYVIHLVRLAEGFKNRSLPEEEMLLLGGDGRSGWSRWRVILPGH